MISRRNSATVPQQCCTDMTQQRTTSRSHNETEISAIPVRVRVPRCCRCCCCRCCCWLLRVHTGTPGTCLPLFTRHLESLRVVKDVPALQDARWSSQWLAYTLPLLAQIGRCFRAHLRAQTHMATIPPSAAETWHSRPAPQYFSRHGLSRSERGWKYRIPGVIRDTPREICVACISRSLSLPPPLSLSLSLSLSLQVGNRFACGTHVCAR
jgi:hypothetical protein